MADLTDKVNPYSAEPMLAFSGSQVKYGLFVGEHWH